MNKSIPQKTIKDSIASVRKCEEAQWKMEERREEEFFKKRLKEKRVFCRII